MPQRPVKSNRFCHQFYESAVQPHSDIVREIDIFLKKNDATHSILKFLTFDQLSWLASLRCKSALEAITSFITESLINAKHYLDRQ